MRLYCSSILVAGRVRREGRVEATPNADVDTCGLVRLILGGREGYRDSRSFGDLASKGYGVASRMSGEKEKIRSPSCFRLRYRDTFQAKKAAKAIVITPVG
jgi:hypothetical protein